MNKSFSKIRHIQEANQRLEKRLVENVIVEGEVSEQLPGLVKSLVQGGKNLMNKVMGTAAKKAPQYFDELPVSAVDDLLKAGVPRSTATLLGKLGTVKMSDVLARFLSPVRDEVVVVLRDFKNIMSTLPKPKQGNDVATGAFLRFKDIGDDLARNLDAIQTPKGQTVDLANIYLVLKESRNKLSSLNFTLQLDPANKRLFQIFQQNLDDAIVKFDEAIAEIITK